MKSWYLTTFVGIINKYIDSQDLQELKVGCEYVVPEKEFFATPIDNMQLDVGTVPLVLKPVPPAKVYCVLKI